MKAISILIFSFIIGATSVIFIGLEKNQEGQIHREKWVKLFNGKDLKNWKIKIKGYPLNENYKNTFRVVDEMIQVNYDEYEEFDDSYGHIFYKNEFSNYRLRLQYKFVGKQLKGGAGWAKRNSGIMIHCQSPESMGLNQNFPVSIEVQLLGGLNEGERPTANLCTPGTNVVMHDKLVTKHCINSSSKTFNGEQWVQVEVLVRNDSVISHWINGIKVLSYNKPQIGGSVDFDEVKWKNKEGMALKKGFISLQSESHPVAFKNIEILELD